MIAKPGHFVLLAVVLMPFSALLQRPKVEPSVTIQAKMVAGRGILIPVDATPGGKMWFILDTGASGGMMFNSRRAKEIGVSVTGKHHSSGAGENDFEFGDVNDLKLQS